MSEIIDMLDEKTGQRLKMLGDLRAQQPDDLAKQAIEDFLDREEEYEDQKREDLARLGRYRRTGKYISHERVMAWLNDLVDGKDTPCPK
jgi:predicted transcriptional regulator